MTAKDVAALGLIIMAIALVLRLQDAMADTRHVQRVSEATVTGWGDQGVRPPLF